MKSWTEKFNAPARVAIKPAPVSIAGMRAGEVMLVPFWRVLDKAPPTTKRLTFGAAFVHENRREEGLPE
ncbi:hypothetical protein [Mesorhizobium sp. 1B3]|uniref:hypothetical protein n=1 Tax=Mesorhizobium sp. 1B3 TaxID=3243599 RepID=UPI003D96A5CB